MADELIDQNVANPRSGATLMVEEIRQAIQAGRLRTGERLPPLRQLAKQYGVSFGTATAAIGQLQWEGLVSKRVGSGTYVTFGAASEHSESTAPVHVWLRLKTHVYQELADELLGLLQKSRIEARMGVWQADGGAEQAVELMRGWDSRPPRALVTHWEFPAVAEILRQGLPENLRVIATFGEPQSLPCGWHSVNPDRREMCRIAVDHLVAKGHRRIGFVTHSRSGRPPEQQLSHSRLGEWYFQYVAALGTALRDKGVPHALSIHYLKWEKNSSGQMKSDPMTEANVERAVEWLSGPERPTAVVGDDGRMMMVKHAAERLGLRVPQDVELLGFGDTPWSQAGNFSTISYNLPQIARGILQLIEAAPEELDGATRHVVVRPTLIVR